MARRQSHRRTRNKRAGNSRNLLVLHQEVRLPLSNTISSDYLIAAGSAVWGSDFPSDRSWKVVALKASGISNSTAVTKMYLYGTSSVADTVVAAYSTGRNHTSSGVPFSIVCKAPPGMDYMSGTKPSLGQFSVYCSGVSPIDMLFKLTLVLKLGPADPFGSGNPTYASTALLRSELVERELLEEELNKVLETA